MNASTDPEVSAMHSEESSPVAIGARLAQARQAKGLSLGDVARQLKLTVKQVEALERDDHASFGSMVFVRGFLRGYARFVQLDINDDLARLEPAAPAQSPAVQAQRRAVPLRSSRAPVWMIAGAVSLIGVVGVFVAAHQMGKDSPASAPLSAPPAGSAAGVATALDSTATPPMPSAAAANPVDAQNVVQSPAVAIDGAGAAAAPAGGPTAAAATAGAPGIASTASGTTSSARASNAAAAAASTSEPVLVTSPSAPDSAAASIVAGPEVKLVFEADAWVEVRDRNGMVVFSQMNQAGSEQVIRGEGPLSLVVGNARHVRVSYQGAPIDLGPHIRLDVARLTLK